MSSDQPHVERRIEAQHEIPDYQAKEFSEEDIAAGRHRGFVGGFWDEMGQTQLDFLVSQGLTPEQRFLDVGCGSFRAGRFLVRHLDPGNYYGIDISADVIETGYRVELDDDAPGPVAAGEPADDRPVRLRLRRAVRHGDRAVGVHPRLAQPRPALSPPPGKGDEARRQVLRHVHRTASGYPIDGVRGRSYTERNAFWYYRRDLRYAAQRTPFDFRYIGEWGHSRNQRMVEYTRRPD